MCNFVKEDKNEPCTADKKAKCTTEDIGDEDNFVKIKNYKSGWYLKVENGKIVGTNCCSEATLFNITTTLLKT